MKFPEHKLFMETVRLPSPVQKWFGHQLEIRGIDSVIYSRHIIHLLQQDDDEIQDYVDLFFDSKAEKKHQCKAARYDKKKVKNSEERKKSAAIECLQAVSDEDNDIETLVEELCHKLKNLEQHDEGNATNSQEAITSSSESDSSSSEFENPAERYYAAFPALHGKDQNNTPNDSQSVWKNNPITKPKSDQTGEIEAESNQEELHPKYQQQEHLSPETLNRKKKKQTVKKLHAKRTPSRKEDSCYRVCRFLSWPNGSLNIENPATQAHSLQDQELCSQVETMLKEMLLQKEEQALKMPSPGERMRKPACVGDTAWENRDTAWENSPEGTDGSVSPELQENDSWYTQPIDILFTSEEPRQRLYKRNNSSSVSPYQQRSGSISPISPNDSLNQQSLNESPKENQFLFPYSSSETSETKNCFPADPTFTLFNQPEPKAIPSRNSDLNPDVSGFSVLSPFDNLLQAAPSNEREERYRANSFTENISNSLSLTTVSDLEDINKGVDDLDFDINLTTPEDLLDHQYMEQFLNTANDQEVYYWDNNLQSFDGFLPWTVATTWPSKVLVDDLMPDVSWEERYEGYSADFYNHLKLGKIWQVWDVNYQKITGAYCSPWKNLLHTCWSDHGLFGMSNHWDSDTHRQQADIWGNYGICSESTSWGDFGKLKDSYQQSWLDEGPGPLETPDDGILLEDPCNPLVMVDVDQDSIVCQLENQNSELIPQIQFDLVSETGSEYDNVLSDGENDQLSNSEEEQSYCRSVSYGDFQTMWSMVEHSTPKKFSLSQSFELVPSERSAFVDVVPKKIHHVQSEPNLVTQERDSLSASISKSRSCKSDSSSPEEHLYFSQKTHFQPIQSPVAQYTGSTYNLRDLFGGYAPSKTPYQKFQKNAFEEADDDEEKSFVPMFKIRKDQDKYIQTSGSLDNCGDDKDSIEFVNNQAGFRELENGGQVFDLFGYVDNLTECLESTPQNLLDCVNNYADSGYEDIDQPVQEREEAERNGLYRLGIFKKKNMDPWSTENGFQPKNNRCCGEGLSIGGNWQTKISAPLNENTRNPLDESKNDTCSCGKVADFENWEENTSKVACVCKPPVHRWVIQEAWGLNPGSGGEMEPTTKHSIWSSGYEDGAFSEMFYYPEKDEESIPEQFNMDGSSSSKVDEHPGENELNLFEYNQDLVSDVNEGNCRMGNEKISDQHNSYQAEFDPYGQSFMEMTSYFRDDLSDASKARPDQQCVGQLGKENHPPPKDESDIVKVKLVIKKGKKKQDFENLDTHPPLFKPMPVAAVYSCELEHAWMNNMEVEYLFPQASGSKGKKKPCTFFLEGNCRRTDCKFAHDLSHITCRFWEEGDCFKGELCPFLHGYSPYKRHVSDRKDSKQFQFEADEFPNLTKSESKKDRAKKDKYHKLNKYKASKTQLRTQINKKIQKSNVIQESTASLSKKLKQKGSQ